MSRLCRDIATDIIAAVNPLSVVEVTQQLSDSEPYLLQAGEADVMAKD